MRRHSKTVSQRVRYVLFPIVSSPSFPRPCWGLCLRALTRSLSASTRAFTPGLASMRPEHCVSQCSRAGGGGETTHPSQRPRAMWAPLQYFKVQSRAAHGSAQLSIGCSAWGRVVAVAVACCCCCGSRRSLAKPVALVSFVRCPRQAWSQSRKHPTNTASPALSRQLPQRIMRISPTRPSHG